MAKNLRGLAAQINCFPNQSRQGLLGQGFTLAAYKTVDQAVNTSAVLVADSELAVNLGVTGYWLVELNANLLILNAAHNLRYAFQFPGPDGLTLEANVSRGRGTLNISGVASQEDQITNVTPTITGGTTSAWTSLRLWMGCHVTQPGTFQFQFAQNVSGASNTTVQAGSVLKATYLANNLGS